MKKPSSDFASVEPTNENDIRDYAYYLYVRSCGIPGHDLENWLEAENYLATFNRRPERNPRLSNHGRKQAQQARIAKQTAA